MNNKNLLDPDMPSDQIRLQMGELTNNELLVARAAIRWANTRADLAPTPDVAEMMVEALKFYAEENNYYTDDIDGTSESSVQCDYGKIAEKALAAYEAAKQPTTSETENE